MTHDKETMKSNIKRSSWPQCCQKSIWLHSWAASMILLLYISTATGCYLVDSWSGVSFFLQFCHELNKPRFLTTIHLQQCSLGSIGNHASTTLDYYSGRFWISIFNDFLGPFISASTVKHQPTISLLGDDMGLVGCQSSTWIWIGPYELSKSRFAGWLEGFFSSSWWLWKAEISHSWHSVHQSHFKLQWQP